MPRDSRRPSSKRQKNPRKPRLSSGPFCAESVPMLISFQQEISMNHIVYQTSSDAFLDPVERLNAMIAAARADVAAAKADASAAAKGLAAIEPHPFAHGYQAAGDCLDAGILPGHFLALAGLLAQPWKETLESLEDIKQQLGDQYLLKAFAAVFEVVDGALDAAGAALVDARADRVDGDLIALFKRRPDVALGMVWRLFGFDRRHANGWMGTFACGERLSTLVASTDLVDDTTMLGDALAATVAGHWDELSAIGAAERHARASHRYAERQASWAALPDEYRLAGPWRGWAPTKQQRRLMQRIESRRGLPMPIDTRRGASADAITGAGGNPRFDISDEGKM